MIRTLLMAAASLVLVASAALAQRASIVSVDKEQKQIVVQVGEADYKVDASRIELLDSDGKAAAVTDFRAKEKVMVTMTNQQITRIQKLKEKLAAQDPQEGKVVSTDAEQQRIVVKIGAVEYTAYATKTKLLDQDGKPAKFADFAAGDKVKVTLTDAGVVTAIQKSK